MTHYNSHSNNNNDENNRRWWYEKNEEANGRAKHKDRETDWEEVNRRKCHRLFCCFAITSSSFAFVKQSKASMRAFGIQIFVSKLSRQVREYTLDLDSAFFIRFILCWLVAPGGNGVTTAMAMAAAAAAATMTTSTVCWKCRHTIIWCK